METASAGVGSLLSQFESQYSTQTAEITAKIGQLQQLNNESHELPAAISAIENLLAEVEELLEQMELTVRELPSDGVERRKYDNRVLSYKNDKKLLSDTFKSTVKRVRRRDLARDRDELFDGDDDDFDDDSAANGYVSRERKDELLRNTERLERSGRKLEDGYRICLETEQIGADVLGNLDEQHGVIQRARDRLREAEDDLGQSSRVLSSMIRRTIQNRIALLLVAAGLLLAFALIIYFSFA